MNKTNLITPFLNKFSKAEDCLAALVGNAPSMKELIKRAKGSDRGAKSFLALVKIYTVCYLADIDGDSTTHFYPAIDTDKDFFKQRWVQKKITEGMKLEGRKGNLFRERFWGAVTYKTTLDYKKFGYAGKDIKSELKRYAILRRDKWNDGLKKKELTFEEILKECKNIGVLSEEAYADSSSFRKHLNNYGVVGERGRPKKREMKK
jgi:hypothetical protein